PEVTRPHWRRAGVSRLVSWRTGPARCLGGPAALAGRVRQLILTLRLTSWRSSMSEKPTILVQLDTDPLPSVFDRVVAVDAGVQYLFSYGGVTAQNAMPLVHGCIFTRGPKDLNRTAIFVGGSDVAAGEAVLAEVKRHLIPQYGLTVSLMLDSNGSNTTAAAAVRAAGRHLD